MYKAFTIEDNGVVVPGILPDAYESVDAEPGVRMELVDVELVPVTAMAVSLRHRPDLGLAFVSPAQPGRKTPDPGCVVDVSCALWRPGRKPTGNAVRAFLDTSTDASRVLVYLTPSFTKALVSAVDGRSFVSTREDGLPVVSQCTRASSMRDAIRR